jgi:hypothetical protein
MLRLSPRTTSAEVRTRTEAKIADIEGKIKSLDAMRKSLLKLVQSCSGCAPLSECPILEKFGQGGWMNRTCKEGLMTIPGEVSSRGSQNFATYAAVGLLVIASVWNACPRRVIAPGCCAEKSIN